ncbi:MAG TPA: acylphosphatase [Gemmatales bacterium]|nr:acylphosphatase [Gemmatales bacterium]
MLRQRMIFHGRVQGVGFRVTALRLARALNLGGWVRNLPNGTVELVVEGSAESIAQLRSGLAERLEGCISDVATTDEPLEGLTGFDIRH